MAVAQRLYARALFQSAKEQQSVARVREELGDFVAALEDVPELAALLSNPQLDPQDKVTVLEDLMGEADELTRHFLLVVAQKGRAGELAEIVRELEELIAADERRLTVELTTAHELSDDDADAIVRQIEEASGRSVDATRKVDPELIGGLVLRAGSLRVDASVRGRLEKLRQELVTR